MTLTFWPFISDSVCVWWLQAVLLCTLLLSWPYGLKSLTQPPKYCMIETQMLIQGNLGTTKQLLLDTLYGNSWYSTLLQWYSCSFLAQQKVLLTTWIVVYDCLKIKEETSWLYFFHISAGQTMKQMDLWCLNSFVHIFVLQIYILVTNKEARSHLWRALKNNRPEPHPQACG